MSVVLLLLFVLMCVVGHGVQINFLRSVGNTHDRTTLITDRGQAAVHLKLFQVFIIDLVCFFAKRCFDAICTIIYTS